MALSAPPGSLIEFLAVRLVLERVALAHLAAELMDYHGPLAGLRAAASLRNNTGHTNPVEGRALLVFQLAQIFHLTLCVLVDLATRRCH